MNDRCSCSIDNKYKASSGSIYLVDAHALIRPLVSQHCATKWMTSIRHAIYWVTAVLRSTVFLPFCMVSGRASQVPATRSATAFGRQLEARGCVITIGHQRIWTGQAVSY